MTYGYKYEYKKYHQNQERANLTLADDFRLEVYVRRNGDLKHCLNAFEEISEIYQKGNLNYIVGKVKSSDLQKTGIFEDPEAVVLLSAEKWIEAN